MVSVLYIGNMIFASTNTRIFLSKSKIRNRLIKKNKVYQLYTIIVKSGFKLIKNLNQYFSNNSNEKAQKEKIG